MPRRFRIWEKKRGGRQTGSQLVGGLGEASFFGALFAFGACALAYFLTSYLMQTDPQEVRLGSGTGFWLMVVVLSSFVIGGGVGLLFTVLQIGTSTERRQALARSATNLDLIADQPKGPQYPNVPRDAGLTDSPGVNLAYRLPVKETEAWALTAATAFCLVWIAISATLASVIATTLNWTLTLLAVPFLIVTFWSIRYLVRGLVVQTSIGPTTIEISRHPLYPGQTCHVFFSQAGRLKIERITLSLVCQEESVYHQGTDLRSEHAVVHQTCVFARQQPVIERAKPIEHQTTFAIPADAMHSFQGTYNQVQWQLVVEATGKGWRSFRRSFPLVVFPRPKREFLDA